MRHGKYRKGNDAVPIYEYECQKCGEEFEKLIRSPKKIKCPECGGEEVRKLLSRFGFKMGVEDKGEWKSGPKK